MKKINIKNFNWLVKYQDIFLLLIIFGAAVFFRLYKLPTIPFGLNNDAAWEGSAAINILHGNISNYLPYAAEGWRGEGIIRVFVAFFMMFLGNNPITIRLASVLFGIGLIIPLFLLIKNLFDTRLAAITSFFVAISGWHITMSKTGWRAITVPFFSTLLFYFYFKGVRSKKMSDFVLAGIMLSVGSLYTYDAGRIILPFFIFWVFFSSFVNKNYLSKYKRGLGVLLASFIIVSIPMLNYAVGNWQNFTSRSDYLFIGNQIQQAGNLSPLINNIVTSSLIFNARANGNDFFIFRPLVDIPVSWLIPIGFLIAILYVLKKKSINFLFMLFWFFASIVPSILSSPNGNRAIGVIPTVYFFAALGLIVPVDYIWKIIKLNNNLKTAFMIAFLVLSSFITYSLYLGPQRLELPGFYPETLVTTNYIKKIWNKYDIYITDNYPRELLTYYLYKNSFPDAFATNYTWYNNSSNFLAVNYSTENLSANYNSTNVLGASTSNKGLAFFMFENNQNEQIANQLLSEFPDARKFYLSYINDNINRTASLVVLVPPK